VRIGKAPIERAPSTGQSALELSLRSHAERKEGVVVDQSVGVRFAKSILVGDIV
jgi:hypothetical protein